MKYASSSDNTVIRHSKDLETPFPLYHGIKLHGDATLKHQIENAHHLGLSVLYDRVMDVKVLVAHAVCKRHAEDGVVLPTNVRRSVFTTHDVDNLDSNKTGNSGIRRPTIILDHNTKSKPKLPDRYIIVPPVVIKHDDVFVPRSGDGHVRLTNNLVPSAKVKYEAWVSHVAEVMQKGELMKGDVITWAGFNSSIRYDESIKPQAEVGIVPLFPDKAASPSMMKHTMEIVKENTEFINAGQTPVLGADQPLYAICKQLKWQFPGSLGEDKFVMQLGALHIEDKCQLMLGKMLRGSDWKMFRARPRAKSGPKFF